MSTRPIPLFGVNLQAFDDFVQQCGGREALDGLTTTQVNDHFLVPKTQAKSSSYCTMLLENEETMLQVGKATVFISHAWKYRFLDVFDCIHYHLKETKHLGEDFVWFDMFSNNQHDASATPFEWWKTTFQNAINSIGRTVLILSPWDDPIPLTRLVELLAHLKHAAVPI